MDVRRVYQRDGFINQERVTPTRILMPEVGGRTVGKVGYGLMGLTWKLTNPTLPSESQSFAALRASLACGCNFWNGGDFYGTPDNNSLTLLKKYYETYPEDADKVVLSIKGGMRDMRPDGSAEFLKQSVNRCVEMLGDKGKIDMFECARRDPNVPVEVTVTALKELVDEGKIGGVALSEVGADTIRAAAKITRIVAVETELSLWHTEPLTNGIAKACAELNIPIVAYSPIGRGMLTGQIKSYEDLPETDFRRHHPRFQPGNFELNLKLVEELEKIAQKRSCTAAQLALGWLLSLSEKPGMPVIIPIPGSTNAARIQENAAAVVLNDHEMQEIDAILGKFKVAGERYPAAGMRFVNG